MVISPRRCSWKRKNKYDVRLIEFDFNRKRMYNINIREEKT